MMKSVLAIFALFIFLHCSGDSPEPDKATREEAEHAVYADPPHTDGHADGDLNILFIGNSLTFSNGLPGRVAKLASADGTDMHTDMVAKPNYALEDHIADGDIQKMIEQNQYDFVVIQQGPSSQADGRESLVTFGGMIKQLCEKAGAKLIYFMVWPSKTYYYTFDGVIENYRNGAIQNDALLAPVGEVWKNHFDQTGDFSYYGYDGFHPSQAGSEVAAAIILKTILDNQ